MGARTFLSRGTRSPGLDRLLPRHLVLAIGVLLVWAMPGSSRALDGEWSAVEGQATVDVDNPIRSRRSPDARVPVHVISQSAQHLAGPLRLVIADLTPASVSLSGASGATAAGQPYVDLPGDGLGAGQTIDLLLTFAGGGRAIFDFVPVLEQRAVVGGELAVQITDPPTLLTVGASPIPVSGTISPPGATLTVNGSLVGHAGGVFNTEVSLVEGHNVIVARATSGGDEVTDSIAISMDLTPPFVTIDSPAAGTVLRTDRTAVTGQVNDIVRGTISADEANVTVNGVSASVSNRTYLAVDVPLVPGANELVVTAADSVGNVGTARTSVTFEPPSGARIALAGGQGQRGTIFSELPQPLTVELQDDSGAPVASKNVVFRVVQGDGKVGAGGPTEAQATLVQTDAGGLASTPFRLGSRAGNGNHRVRATAVGFDAEVIFHASADPNPGDKISVIAGNNQRGAVGQRLPQPVIVAVTDDGSNLIADADVEFRVTAGGGTFHNGAASFVTRTDRDGRASAQWRLGPQAGLDAHRVIAQLVGTEAKAGFTASALVPGAPGATRVSGVVLDNQDAPVPGVTLRIDGTTRHAIAGAQGQFLITEVPVGPVKLVADGSTATVAGEFPTLAFDLVTVAGAENKLPAPIYMVKLDVDNAMLVGSEDVAFTLPEIPGFKLTVKADSVTFPDGSREGLLSVTPVNANKVPMPPPNGMQPQFIVTIQPAGTRFDPPAPLTLPNVDGHLPGAQVEMYSFDHDLEEFVTIGLGTVSADGQLIVSDPGVGVIKAGWHCGSQPGGNGCAHDCPVCKDCDANCNCIAADNDPRLASEPKCTTCNNGTKVPPKTDAQCCSEINAGTDLGYVVCCNTSKITCLAGSLNGADKGSQIIKECIRQHEVQHFGDVDCPGGANECDTTRPPFKAGRSPADGECDAYKVEIACYDNANCGGDAACIAKVANERATAKTLANGIKPGCIP